MSSYYSDRTVAAMALRREEMLRQELEKEGAGKSLKNAFGRGKEGMEKKGRGHCARKQRLQRLALVRQRLHAPSCRWSGGASTVAFPSMLKPARHPAGLRCKAGNHSV